MCGKSMRRKMSVVLRLVIAVTALSTTGPAHFLQADALLSPPAIKEVHTTSTTITVLVTPSGETGTTPITYYLYYKNESMPSYINTGTVDVTQNQTVSSLRPGTVFSVFVKAVNNGGQKDSPVIRVTTKPASPSQPAVKEVHTTSTTVTVRVTASETGISPIAYYLHYKNESMPSYINTETVDPTQNQTISSLQPGTVYDVFVKAKNGGGEMDSDVINVMTEKAAPSQPAVVAVDVTSTNATVKITPSATGITPITCQIFSSIKGQKGYNGPRVSVPNVEQHQTLSPLSPDTEYFVFVKAENTAGENVSAGITVRTKPAVCPNVTAPGNGIMESNGTTKGSVLSFQCDNGYTLNGSKSIICEANGTWNDTKPSCHEVNECELSPNACQNGGTCEDALLNYTCKCSFGYEGVNCEREWTATKLYQTLGQTLKSQEGKIRTQQNQLKKQQTQIKAQLQHIGNLEVSLDSLREKIRSHQEAECQAVRGVINWRQKSSAFHPVHNVRGQIMGMSFQKKRNDTHLRLTWSSNLRPHELHNCAVWKFIINGHECSNPASVNAFVEYTSNSNFVAFRHTTIIGVCRGTSAGEILCGNHQIALHVGHCPYPASYGPPGLAYTGFGSTTTMIVEELCPPH